MLKHFLLGLLASQTALSMRYVMYIDQYVHPPSLSLSLSLSNGLTP